MYRSGQLTYGQNLDRVASIDVRTDDSYDFHSSIHRQILRTRMVRSLGHHDTQVFWFEMQPGPFGLRARPWHPDGSTFSTSGSRP